MVKDLQKYIGLAEAGRITGLTSTRLRMLADLGKLPMIRDPVGRRLLERAAVVRLAEKRTAEKRGRVLPEPASTP